MKSQCMLLLSLLIPVAIMILINEFSPAPTNVYQEEVCSRYCHSNACLHMDENKLTRTLLRAYETNIHWLKHNPLGINYQEMNLLVYVVAYPFLIITLLWGLLRKRNG